MRGPGQFYDILMRDDIKGHEIQQRDPMMYVNSRTTLWSLTLGRSRAEGVQKGVGQRRLYYCGS